MADTTFVNGTVITPAWANDVNVAVYRGIAGGTGIIPSTPSALLTALGGANAAALAASFTSNLIVAGNGPWANPAVSDTQHLLEIVNDNTSYQCFALNTYGLAGVVKENNIHCNRYGGTLASPTVVKSGDYFMSWGYRGWDGSGTLSQSMAAFQYQATQDWTSTHHGGRFKFELAKTDAASRLPAWKLYAGVADGVVMELGDETALASRIINASTTGFLQIHGSQDQAGAQSIWYGHTHATNADEIWQRAQRVEWQNIAGTEVMRLTPSGLAINKGADAAYALEVKSINANAFNVTASGGTTMMYSTNGSGTFSTGENAAASAFYLRKDSGTNRSINAAGTINASGADYAEYMFKASGCGDIAKGQIVGLNAEGDLTDKWVEAISFVVKSTNPSYVGNDTWGTNLTGDAFELARQSVDRIAYAGQVPVNILGAQAGDYIVPIQDGDGISAISVKSPSFEQYMSSVGKVIAIESDGRARIKVKVV